MYAKYVYPHLDYSLWICAYFQKYTPTHMHRLEILKFSIFNKVYYRNLINNCIVNFRKSLLFKIVNSENIHVFF